MQKEWILKILAVVVVLSAGCESRLDNPADPEAGNYVGFKPWVNSGLPLHATINDTVAFAGVFQGPLDKVDRYEWDFDGNGRAEFSSSLSGEAVWVYGEVGRYMAAFTVWDQAGFSKSDTAEVTITNEPPDPQGGPDVHSFVDWTVDLPAEGQDDGRIVEYRWDYQGDGQVDWTGAGPETVQVQYGEAGFYTAVLELVDDDANSAKDTVAVSISMGAPAADAGPDTAVSINDLVVFRGSGVDTNGTLSLYEWDLDGDGVIDWASESTGRTERILESVGIRIAVLTVTDDDGFIDRDTVQVVVTDETPIVAIEDLGTGWCAEPDTLVADVIDDGRIVLYEWDFDGDGMFDWSSEELNWAVNFYSVGDYFPSLRVLDDDGHVTTGTLTYSVSPWARAAPMNVPRSDVGVEAVDGVVYALAGFSYGIGAYLSAAEAYDPAVGKWESRRPMSLSQSGMATAVFGDRIYGIAGCAVGEERGAVEEYWPQYDLWARRTSVRMRRCMATSETVGDRIYIIGGENGEEMSSVEVVHLTTWEWSVRAPMPTPRHAMASVVVDGKVYVIGGVGGGGLLSTVEVYDPATDSWETRSPMPTPRAGLAAVVWNDKIFAIAGSYLDVVEVYDVTTDTWTTGSPMFTKRFGAGAAVIDDVIYVVGGETLTSYLSLLEVYAPSCDGFGP